MSALVSIGRRRGRGLRTCTTKIRRGTLRAFSVGGRFFRVGRQIIRADLHELSVTAVPANPRALFTVMAPVTAYGAAAKAFGRRRTDAHVRELRDMEVRLTGVEIDLAIAALDLNLRSRR
jgi:phage head maturation protease